MTQATLSGPQDHPLATADCIARIESDPSTWIHDGSDSCLCSNCGTRIPLAEGEYIVVTITYDEYSHRRNELERFCSEGCYASWAQAFRESGW